LSVNFEIEWRNESNDIEAQSVTLVPVVNFKSQACVELLERVGDGVVEQFLEVELGEPGP
jgi:hypothetical protein